MTDLDFAWVVGMAGTAYITGWCFGFFIRKFKDFTQGLI